MSVTGQVVKNISIGGSSFTEQKTLSGSLSMYQEFQVQVAQPGVVASGGTTTSGSLTMTNTTHGISTADRVDVYWSGASLIGAVVGTVAGTTVPVSGGTYIGAAALPANTTAVKVCKCQQGPFSMTGNNLVALVNSVGGVMVAGDLATFCFQNGSSVVYTLQVGPGVADPWYSGNGHTNPLAGVTPTQIFYSHNKTDSAPTLKTGALLA
jgi:hypothetical protein